MGDYEEVTVVGNLGKEPEMRYTPDGTAVTNFSMAVNRRKKGDQEVTHWFRVTVWGDLGERCSEFLHKSSKVLVTGALLADEKTGGPTVYKRGDGTPGAQFEINARTVVFLDRADGNRSKPEADDGDVPF